MVIFVSTSCRVSTPPRVLQVTSHCCSTGIRILEEDGYLRGSDAVSTTIVGPVVADNLASMNFIPGLGVPLTRFPLHLIGHSRGGSLVCEIAKRLGEKSIMVDQLTLLDPHPLNADGFEDLVEVTDGAAKNGAYENVTFVDAYYQTVGNGLTIPDGTFVLGSFFRGLNLNAIDSGGYDNPHSNVHLWYHGTMEVVFPVTSDGSASIDTSMRSSWYGAIEEQGAHTGYLYSLRGGGNRREIFTPVNQISDAPVLGLNGTWGQALGVVSATNRTGLIRNTERRANIIELELQGLPTTSVSSFNLGGPVSILARNEGGGNLKAALVYSFNGGGTCRLTVFADHDENSLNGWVGDVQFNLEATGDIPQKMILN